MSPVYRDPDLALRQRLAEARARVTELEARLTPTFWRVQPADRVRALERLRAEAFKGRSAVQELIEATARYVESLSAMVQHARDDDAHWRVPPDRCPRLQPDAPTYPLAALFGAPRRFDEAALEALRARVGSIARRLDPAFCVEDFGRGGVLAELRVDGAPFMLSAVLGDRGGWSAAGATEVAITVRTSVARGAGLLRLRPHEASMHVLSLLTGRGRAGTGDPEFDAWFEVDAEPGAARAQLTDGVRGALCLVARDDAPTLTVDEGVAELRWRFEPSHTNVRAAVDALRGIRAAPAMPLLKEPSRKGPPR
ncbi:MAG: hypothetical protein R3A48_18595 [Polyangiales bacterium]